VTAAHAELAFHAALAGIYEGAQRKAGCNATWFLHACFTIGASL